MRLSLCHVHLVELPLHWCQSWVLFSQHPLHGCRASKQINMWDFIASWTLESLNLPNKPIVLNVGGIVLWFWPVYVQPSILHQYPSGELQGLNIAE